KHLLVASLQEGEFPRRDPGSPLLGDERRASLGIPERSPAEQEERYLFAVCLSRPEETLALSWKQTDDEGRASARSPFVDEVRDLLSPAQPDDPEAPDELMARIGCERGPADVVPAPAEASTPAELARAIAASGRTGWRAALMHVDAEHAAANVEPALADAERTTADEREKPKDLRAPAVLEALGAVDLFGASTLENYETCSYRWLVGHELRPQRLDPADEPLVLGGLAHKALEELYKDQPAGTPRPTPETLGAWRARAAELVTRIAAESDLPASDSMALAQARRVEGLIAAHLADEAAAERVLAPDPLLLEAEFGEDKDKDPLQLDGVRLHGQIDRVDVGEGPGGRVGLVTDYKLSREVTTAAALSEEGKLQLQLYSLALRELWGIEPLGGVYLPLRGTDKRMGRGLLRGEMKELLEGYGFVSTDLRPDEAFDAALDEAKAAAERIAGDIRTGRVRRDPQGGECPRFCRWQTICRKERGMEEEEDEEELDA
nr:PD-(D/E)XK nuclease family protein [Solirubrobacterales bacterium]